MGRAFYKEKVGDTQFRYGMNNINRAINLIGVCRRLGVSEFCVCAGARNAPLVVALEKLKHTPSRVGGFKGEPLPSDDISTRCFFDERSAAFFALGRIKSNGEKPVAVVTTSGTAVAELYPAVIEAYYTKLPLLLVTADRPPSYRHSGAPQSINQLGVFSHYAPTFDWGLDHEVGYEVSLKSISGPIHINISFDEPLLGEEWIENEMKGAQGEVGWAKSEMKRVESGPHSWRHSQSPLVILGGVPEKYRADLITQLKKINRPIYAEAPSGLRERDGLCHLVIRAGSQSIEAAWTQGEFDSVLRVGSVPTLSFWRELDTIRRHVSVHSVSHLPFSGLARQTESPQSFESFFEESGFHFEWGKKWLQWDVKKSQGLEELYERFPNSEPSMVNLLSHQIASDEMVFLGNSLPIREWDLCASFRVPHENIKTNRGVNGIDGLVSSFLGSMNSTKRNWCLLGDLSALYDLSGLWLKGREELKPFNIVVVNNGGGKIFSQIFGRTIFENCHQIQFKSWAELFGLEYHLFQTGLDVSQVKTRSAIIELQPDNEQSREFWVAYSGLFEEKNGEL